MASAAQRNIRSISYAKYGYFFILPFFLIYAFFQIWPLINTFILSFHGNGSNDASFVGLENYKNLLFGTTTSDLITERTARNASEDFYRYLGNTFILWIGNFIPQIALSLGLAVWFTDAKLKIKGKGFFKIIMYMPNIITAASVAALFFSLFSDSKYGAINKLLLDWEIIDNEISFVAGKWEARMMIMFIQCWMWFGNTMIMLMSGIMGLNPSLFEAANIDGASSGQVFRKITLPLLKPIMLYTLITSMIGGLQMFDIPQLYQNRKPNEQTTTIAVYIYKNFMGSGNEDSRFYGYAGAASVILFFITVGLGCITFRMNRDQDEAMKKKERKAQKKAFKAKQKAMGGIKI